jgi:NADH-quinone oxidoreductase subunit J
MSSLNALFYINAVVAVVGAFFAMTRKNAVHALLYLVLSALALSIAIYLLSAPVAAALEVIVYAGAIMVLFIFVVMLLNVFKKEQQAPKRGIFYQAAMAGFLAILLAGELISIITISEFKEAAHELRSVKDLALLVFNEYGLMVEISSMILLAGLVGAFHVGKKTETKVGSIQ